jgi:hypothetical protein
VHYNKLNSWAEWCWSFVLITQGQARADVTADVTAVVSAGKGCTNLWYKRFRVQKKWVTSEIFKKYLQCVLAAKILTVDFVVCTLAVKKKSGQVSTCRIRPFPCQSYPTQRKKKPTGSQSIKRFYWNNFLVWLWIMLLHEIFQLKTI